MHPRRVDLNLLQVFDTVMTHRSVVLASQQLRLSPSAISHSLRRLRHLLKDELFFRNDNGMQPTRRALELAGPVREGLALLETALAIEPFTPEVSNRTFRLSAGDYAFAVILPQFIGGIARKAPLIDLKITPISRLDVGRQLDTGAVDLVIGWFGDLPEGLRRQPLVKETGVLVVREGHPVLQGPTTRKRVLAYPHIVVDLTGAEEMRGDGFLDDRGLVRRVWMERLVLEARNHPDVAARAAVSVPQFTAVPPLLRATDMIATLPSRIARMAVAEGGLAVLKSKAETGSVDIEVAWHARTDGDAGLRWLRQELVAACASLPGTG